MSSEITVFDNPEFGSIRTLEIEGQPFWVAIDVTKVLGYKRNQNAVRTHCRQALKQGLLTRTGEKQVYIIPESDLYRLIVHSKLKSARRFEKWIFEEVLPQIRRTGSYTVPQNNDQDKEEQVSDRLTEQLDSIKTEIKEIRHCVYAGTILPDSKPLPVFTKMPKTSELRREFINYMLSALSRMLELPINHMLSRAYKELENEMGINLTALKVKYLEPRDLGNSPLYAIYEDRQASEALIDILVYNMKIAFEEVDNTVY